MVELLRWAIHWACTGTKLTIQITGDMKRLNKKYGIVTACVGGGQGIAGIIENIN
jgi:acetyl-CoA acyltransferase